MPNRTLALDVAGPTLRAALVETTLRSHRVLGLYATPRAPGGDLGADVRALVTRHGLTWDEVISVLPGELVTHRILTLPFRDRRRLDRTVPFELETHLPFEIDDAVIDYQVLGEREAETVVLAVLAPKAAVRDHLAALASAGIDPRLVDLATLAALNLLRVGDLEDDGVTAFLTLEPARTAIAVLRGRTLVGLRTLSHGVRPGDDAEAVIRDVRWSLLALAGEDAFATLQLWIGGEAATTPGLAAALERALGTPPRGMETLALAAVPPTLRRDQSAFATTLGLALREGAPDGAFGVDLRRGEFAYHREREALWTGLARAAVLAAVALALMIAAFVLDARALQARRDATRAEIRAFFTAALPAVRTIVNEKAQLTTEIATLEKQRKTLGGLAPSAPRAIDLLRALTVGVPDDVQLDIDELTLDGETLRIRGATRTYEGVEAVKRALAARPEFRAVQAKDVRASVDGQRIDFRLSLDIASGEPR